MSEKIVVRSSTDDHVFFTSFMAYYQAVDTGTQNPFVHRHTELEISAIMGGAGVYTCAGADYPFAAGDVFFHCSDDEHFFSRVDDDKKFSVIVLKFDPRFIWSPSGAWFSGKLLRLFTTGSKIHRHIPAAATAAKEVYRLLNEIFAECKALQPDYDMAVKARMMMMFAAMVRHFDAVLEKSEAQILPCNHLKKMEDSMTYILSHLDAPLTLDTLATKACMSRSYYSTMFKELNGITVWDYICCQRIELAKYRLETTDLSVTEVAGGCGFNNIANFNRAFKKYTGKTPRAYRTSGPGFSYVHI